MRFFVSTFIIFCRLPTHINCTACTKTHKDSHITSFRVQDGSLRHRATRKRRKKLKCLHFGVLGILNVTVRVGCLSQLSRSQGKTKPCCEQGLGWSFWDYLLPVGYVEAIGMSNIWWKRILVTGRGRRERERQWMRTRKKDIKREKKWDKSLEESGGVGIRNCRVASDLELHLIMQITM